MVRIKHRYLLVHILFPESAESRSKVTSETALPHLVQFHRPSPNELTPQLLARAIRDQVLLLYGDYGLGLISSSLNGYTPIIFLNLQAANVSQSVKYLSPATSTAIVRCSRDHFRLVWGALAYMTQLPKTSKQAPPRPCVMQVVRTSGTIKKAEEEAIKRARAAILRANRETGEGTTDELMGLLGQPDEVSGGSGNGKKKAIAGSDVSDEEDRMEMESEDEGD